MTIDPEMAEYLAAMGAAMRAIGLPAEDAPPQVQRDFQEAMNAALPAQPIHMESVEDRWIAARGRRIFTRVYRPNASASLPIVVYAHGGGWFFSSVDTHDDVARRLASDTQAAVVSIDYALSPEAKFPQALEECAAVVTHLAAHGAAWHLDGTRIALAGDSAGANLILGAAILMRDRGRPPLRGIFAAYPVCDSDFTTESYRDFGTGLPLTAERMQFFWRAYIRDAADMHDPLAAPLRADLAGLPPMYIAVAEMDVLASEGLAFAQRARLAGVDVTCETAAGLTHGFLRASGSVARARRTAEDAARWLRALLIAQE